MADPTSAYSDDKWRDSAASALAGCLVDEPTNDPMQGLRIRALKAVLTITSFQDLASTLVGELL